MSKFSVAALKRVDKELVRIHPNDKKKVFKFLSKLVDSPFPKGIDIMKMTGTESTYRVKIGKLRIIYTVLQKENRIIITRVRYRKTAYRN